MKKIALFALTIVISAAFGVAYAGEFSNGITNFAGKTINTSSDLSTRLDTVPGVTEGSNPGGLRSADLGLEKMNNGVTDFSGRTIDTLSDLGPAGPGASSHSLVKSAPFRASVPDFGKPLTN